MCRKKKLYHLCRAALCACVLLAAGGVRASAQENRTDVAPSVPTPYKYEMRAFWSGCPMYGVAGVNNGNWAVSPGNNSIHSIYQNYTGDLRVTGNIGFEFAYNIMRWLAVTCSVSTNIFWHNMYDSRSGQRYKTHCWANVSVVPMVRFSYLTRRSLRLYSSAGFGVALGSFEYGDGLKGYPHIQTVPFGVALGDKVYGFAQLELGTLCCGGSWGVGVRF